MERLHALLIFNLKPLEDFEFIILLSTLVVNAVVHRRELTADTFVCNLN